MGVDDETPARARAGHARRARRSARASATPTPSRTARLSVRTVARYASAGSRRGSRRPGGRARPAARAAAARRNRSGSPRDRMSNARRAACRNGRVRRDLNRGTAVRAVADDRDGRSRRGARGSGACARSRAVHSSRLHTGSSYVALHLVLGARRFALVAHGHARAPRRGATDRCVDQAARRREAAPHERDIPAIDVVRARAASTSASYARGGARDDQQAARVAVEPVHDAGTARVTDARDLGIAREQTVDERARRVPGAGMHDETRGLGHDDHVVVFEAHVEHRRPGPAPAARRSPVRRAAR